MACKWLPYQVMRRLWLMLAVACAVLVARSEAASAQCVVRAELDSVINAATAEYLQDAIETAERDCQALLVVVDTPGGDLEATRTMVRSILSAKVPVIAYVAPVGARAGSAGMFVVLASHVAAMAPSTTIGAAHPVTAGGGDPEQGGQHMGRKIENDAAAFARTIAGRHGRSETFAEAAVRDSRSATEVEALRQNVIDMIATDESALLATIDGRTIDLADGAASLSIAGAEILEIDLTVSQKVRATLGHPSLAYLLLMLGLLGIVAELFNPGMIIPGVLGLVSLLLAAIGLDMLPVNASALALLALAAGFFVAEVYVTSYGLLFVIGLAALATASALFIDHSDPGFFADSAVDVSWQLMAPMIAMIAIALGLLAWQIVRTRRLRSPTGAEGLLGSVGVASTDITREGGHVQVAGERWSATSDQAVLAGEPIEVVEVKGLHLQVCPRHDQEIHHHDRL